MKHTVVIFSKENKAIYGKAFRTAHEAYDEYLSKIAISKNILGAGDTWKVVRYRDGKMMAMHECIGE